MNRLTPATLTILMFGLVGLLVAGYVAKNLFAREEKKPQVQNRTIPMALVDIEPGTYVTENHVGDGFWPTDKLERDMLLSKRTVIGRVAKQRIKAAQPIRANWLYGPGETPDLNISPGMKAVTVDVGDAGSIVDGLIKPGNYVDVLFTVGYGTDDRLHGGLTMRLFEGVKVLAINSNQSVGRVDRRSNRVTLEVSDAQANIVTLADKRGDLTLVFNPGGRGTGGLALSAEERVTLNQILGLRQAPAETEPYTTEVYRGSRATSWHRFDSRGRRLDNGNGSAGSYRPDANGQRRWELPGVGPVGAPGAIGSPAGGGSGNDGMLSLPGGGLQGNVQPSAPAPNYSTELPPTASRLIPVQQ